MDLQLVKKLLAILKKEGVERFEWEDEQFRVSIEMSDSITHSDSCISNLNSPDTLDDTKKTTNSNPEALPENHRIISAPLVGTFYRAPSPTGSPFVKEGDTVKSSQVLAIIEAMKLLNELEAEFPCVIVKVLAENASSVEFGQPLFEVELV